VPELPDIAILTDAFQAALVGRPVLRSEAAETLVLRGTPGEQDALGGQVLESVSRRGKFIVLQLDRDRIVVNAMLTGRLGLGLPDAKPLPSTAWTLRFGSRLSSDPVPSAPWTLGADWLPPASAEVELRYRDPTRMGKIYLVPSGSARAVAGWDELGPDADDPSLDLSTWRARIQRHRGELKNLLREQSFVAGIGNGYSDEILWTARLAPFRKRSTLAAEEVDRLHEATRATLAWAIDELRARVPPRFEVEVRDFLHVHRKGGQTCPRCGSIISEIAPGGFVTSFCRGCQR
jgi:formamidopyrimidine-DNA glycosylase